MLSIVAFYSKYTRARIFENMCLIDKLLLQRLVGVVNTQLLERVVLKHFETENIQHANKMLFDLCLLSSR